MTMIYLYAPQIGRHFEENSLYKMRNDWDMHSADELALCLDHISRHAEKIFDVDGMFGTGERNLEGILLEFSLEKELCTSRTYIYIK